MKDDIEELRVSEEIEDEFVKNVENTLSQMSIEQLRAANLFEFFQKALVLSFDALWEPFIGYTKGYNQPDARTYLQKPFPFFLLKISEKMSMVRHSDIPGGRFFIHKSFCYFNDRYYGRINLYKLVWPTKIDAVEKIRRTYSQLLSL